MALGGAVCGGLLGIPLGAVIGVIIGLCFGHVSWGLDGAVLGILSLALTGAIVGVLLGVTADDRSLQPIDELTLHPPRDPMRPR